MSVIDEQVAHLYEQSSDWDERVKRRWRQAIQPTKIRLGLRGSSRAWVTITCSVSMTAGNEPR